MLSNVLKVLSKQSFIQGVFRFPHHDALECVLVFIFFTGIKTGFSDLSVIFSTFDLFAFLFSESRLLFHDFP